MTDPLITISPRYICLNATARELLGHRVDFEYKGDGTWVVKPNGHLSVDHKGQISSTDVKVLIASTTGAKMFRLSKVSHVNYQLIPGVIQWDMKNLKQQL